MKILILSFGNGGMLHYAVDLINSISRIKINSIYFLTTDLWREFPENVHQEQILKNKNIYSTIKAFDPDVIHITSFHPFLLLLIFRIRKYRIVYTVHDCMSHPYGYSLIKRLKLKLVFNKFTQSYLLKYVNVIVTLSSFVAGELYIMHKKKSVMIPLVNYKNKFEVISKNSVYEFDPNYINVLLFGTLGKYKGIDTVLNCVKFISNNSKYAHIRFIVAGRVISDVKKVENEHLVFIDQFIQDSMIDNLFNGCSLVFLPYIEASQSGVFSLAMSYNIPILSSSVGSFNEYGYYYSNSICYYNDDPQNILEQIVELAQRPKKRSVIFDMDFLAKKYLNVYG